MSSSNLYTLKGKICLLILLTFSSFVAQAQNSSTSSRRANSRGYLGFYASVGANAWQVRESQFNLLFDLSSSDFINRVTSISSQTYAPLIALGAEFGGTSSYFGGINTQFSFGGMIGSYIDITGGINLPIINDKATIQIGTGIFYQIATKELDRRRLRQSVRLDGRFFNTINTFTTSLTNENLGIRPFATLKIPLGKSSLLRIQGGYQFNFYENVRIRFRQTRSSGRNSSASTVARFRIDDNLFDFKYNNQYINKLPFDYSGFFVNVGVMWTLGS